MGPTVTPTETPSEGPTMVPTVDPSETDFFLQKVVELYIVGFENHQFSLEIATFYTFFRSQISEKKI